jgi:enoyl-CoA hydratase/3-hydroxyacyl-CoA dehydrogenase
MIHIFFSSKQSFKIPNITDIGLKPRNIKNIAIIGGGIMGSGIATICIMNGFTCYIKEINQKFLDLALLKVKENLSKLVKSGKLKEKKMSKILNLLIPTLDYSNFNKMDIVIEAIIENIQVKQNLFQDLEKYCSKNCILATNTSTISLELIGTKIKSQDRIVGTHFFNPAHIMELLEIVRTNQTSPQILLDILNFSTKINKIPIVVGNCIGFTVNRIFSPYSQAALFLVEHGIDLYQIDKILENFGFPIGVFKMNDLAGIDILVHVGNILQEAYKDRFYKSFIPFLMVKYNRLGKKNLLGFYNYSSGKPIPDISSVKSIIEEAKLKNEFKNIIINNLSEQDIIEIILYPVVNEACMILEENMVVRSSDIDIGSVYGYGFPIYKGGIMKWAESEGFNKIYQKLLYFQQIYETPLFLPSSYLKKIVNQL